MDIFAGSSNGRTPPFGGGYPGSNPGPAAKEYKTKNPRQLVGDFLFCILWLSLLNKIRTFFKENPDADF